MELEVGARGAGVRGAGVVWGRDENEMRWESKEKKGKISTGSSNFIFIQHFYVEKFSGEMERHL